MADSHPTSSDGEPLEIETTPAPDDIQFLDDRLYEYNVGAIGIRTESYWRSSSATEARSRPGSTAIPVRIARVI
jgi:hypothetical protein